MIPVSSQIIRFPGLAALLAPPPPPPPDREQILLNTKFYLQIF